MIRRNDPKVIFDGVQERARRAVEKVQHDKWIEINDFSWILLARIFGEQWKKIQ